MESTTVPVLLLLARRYRQLRGLSLLIERGVDFLATDVDGRTALECRYGSKQQNIATLLKLKRPLLSPSPKHGTLTREQRHRRPLNSQQANATWDSRLAQSDGTRGAVVDAWAVGQKLRRFQGRLLGGEKHTEYVREEGGDQK